MFLTCSDFWPFAYSIWIFSPATLSCDQLICTGVARPKKRLAVRFLFVAFGLVAALQDWFLFQHISRLPLQTPIMSNLQTSTNLMNICRRWLKRWKEASFLLVCDNKLSLPRMLCSPAWVLIKFVYIPVTNSVPSLAGWLFFFSPQDLQTNTGLNSSQCSVQGKKKPLIILPFPPK